MSRKKAIPNGTLQNATNNDARPARERLASSVLEDLWSIWQANPRVPSINSRRSWAISRNANPRLVDSWFLRRRTCAKKAGQPITDESYDLPLDMPIAPKRERTPTPILDLPSDDTLVYPPESDGLNDIEASSDTVLDDDTSVDPKTTEPLAYNEVLQQPWPEEHHTQPKPSLADHDAEKELCDEGVLFENLSFPVCNQGRGEKSDFTCILCSKRSAQDQAPSALFDFETTSDSRGDLSITCARLDFSPDTLSELSAIPFLFRTPCSILPDNLVKIPSVDDWSNIEDELGHLVSEEKLDFSFLDVPHLTFMELH